MTKKLLFAFLLFSMTHVFAQDQKWSVEANYTIIPGDGLFGEDDFIDVGLKYRFVKLGLFNLGFGVNGGFSSEDVENTGFDSRRDNTYLIQPRVFSELVVPGFEKLRPSLGVGYSFLNTVSSRTINGMESSDDSWVQGFNLNFGISYNISKRFFLQAQYDFIDLTLDDDVPNDILLPAQINGNINNIRLGVGFRF